jgi:hypothetical protein
MATDTALYTIEKNKDELTKLHSDSAEARHNLHDIYNYFHTQFVTHVFPRIAPTQRIDDLSRVAHVDYLMRRLEELEENAKETPLEREMKLGKYESRMMGGEGEMETEKEKKEMEKWKSKPKEPIAESESGRFRESTRPIGATGKESSIDTRTPKETLLGLVPGSGLPSVLSSSSDTRPGLPTTARPTMTADTGTSLPSARTTTSAGPAQIRQEHVERPTVGTIQTAAPIQTGPIDTKTTKPMESTTGIGPTTTGARPIDTGTTGAGTTGAGTWSKEEEVKHGIDTGTGEKVTPTSLPPASNLSPPASVVTPTGIVQSGSHESHDRTFAERMKDTMHDVKESVTGLWSKETSGAESETGGKGRIQHEKEVPHHQSGQSENIHETF